MPDKKLQPTAVLMIMLVITFPFYVSSVYAEINSVKVTGRDGLDNLADKDYNIIIEATVVLDLLLPQKENVRLRHLQSGLSTRFDSCTSSGNSSSVCKLNIIKNVNSEIEICPLTELSIELYGGTNLLDDSKTVIVKCDILEPEISATISKTKIGAEDIRLNYVATDPKNSGSDCSGIKKVEFSVGGNGVATKETNSNLCYFEGSTVIPSSSYSEGNYSVLVRAIDYMGKSSVTILSFSVDKTGPKTFVNYTITDNKNNEIKYFRPGKYFTDIDLTIYDDSGITDYKLSAKNLSKKDPACTHYGTSIVCKWKDILIEYNKSSVFYEIGYFAVDGLGNAADRKISIDLDIPEDRVPPDILIRDITISTIDGLQREWFRPDNMKMSFIVVGTDDVSGVKSLEADFVGMDIVSGDSADCTVVGTNLECEYSDLIFFMDVASYQKDIIFTATDYAGNENSKTQNISIEFKEDNVASQVIEFAIKRKDGQNISTWIGNSPFNAELSVTVLEKGSGLLSVVANLYNLNSDYASLIPGKCAARSTVRAPRLSKNETSFELYPQTTYSCVWDIQINLNSSGNPLSVPINFNLTDNVLNVGLPTYSQEFYVDLDPPVATLLETDHKFGSNYYVGLSDNTFIARITDNGVGINNLDVYLDLHELGLSANLKADVCTESACLFFVSNEINFDEGPYDISVNTNTMDDLGNKLQIPFFGSVILDKTQPEVKSVLVEPAAASVDVFEDYIQIGNAMFIVLNLTESTSLASATLDLSNFISDETADLADGCEQQLDATGNKTDNWFCMWATDEIDISRYKKGNIYFNITDVAGNNLVYPYEIEVFESAESIIDYWSADVFENSPHAIDRQIVTYYNPSMVFSLGLSSKEGKTARQTWPIDIFIESCSGEGAGYISSEQGNLPILIDHNADSAGNLPYIFYLNYELEQTAPQGNSIEIPCVAKIKTLIDNKKLSRYETENITVRINYYNNPLGEIEENIQNEIDEVKDSWLVSAEWLGKISTIIQWIGKICGIVTKMMGVFRAIAKISDGILDPSTRATIGNLAVALEGQTGTFWHSINKFCKYLNCQAFYGADYGGGKVELVGKYNEKYVQDNPVTKEGFTASGEEATNILADVGRFGDKYSAHFTPKDSLVLSIAYLCLPGVIHNLQKARVIDCQYVRCLKSTTVGMPVHFCVKQRDFGWCKFVYGQVLNLLPIKMITQFSGMVRDMLNSPAQFISVIVKGICRQQCTTSAKVQGGCYLCATFTSVETLLDVLCDLGIGADQCVPFWDDLAVNDEPCDDIFEDDDEDDDDDDKAKGTKSRDS